MDNQAQSTDLDQHNAADALPPPSPFSRVASLLGNTALERLAAIRVLIVGTGGVGGWCAETLVRSGVMHLTLVDPDIVETTNINRQVMAKPSTLGRPKAQALKEHLAEISPDARIRAFSTAYSPDSPQEDPFDFNSYDYVIDAIDDVKAKAALICNATRSSAVFFSSMGAALRTDPAKVRSSLFKKVAGDGLAKALRSRFKRTLPPPGDFICVWSDELPLEGTRQGAKGSLMQVAAAFGLKLAQLVISSAMEPSISRDTEP